MRPDRSGIETAPESPTPVERYLTKALIPKLKEAQTVFSALKLLARDHTLSDTEYYNAFNPDNQKYSRIFEQLDMVRLMEDDVIIETVNWSDVNTQRRFMAEYVRGQELPDVSAEEATNKINELTSLQRDLGDLSELSDEEKRYIELVELTGLYSWVDTKSVLKTSSGVRQLPKDSVRLAILNVYMLNASHEIPEISEGWNKLGVPGDTVRNLVDASRTREQPNKIAIQWLADRGYISLGMKHTFRHRQEEYLYSVDPRVGSQFRHSAEYQAHLEQNRHNEHNATTAISEVIEKAYTLQTYTLPDGIYMVRMPDLEQAINEAEAGSVIEVVRLGYAHPAFSSAQITKGKHGQRDRKRRMYFVAKEPATLRNFIDSDEYDAWINERRGSTEFMNEWKSRMQEYCTEAATIVPDQFQPAYLVRDRDIQTSIDKAMTSKHLATLGYVVAVSRANFDIKTLPSEVKAYDYIYFPDPANGRAYTESLRDSIN